VQNMPAFRDDLLGGGQQRLPWDGVDAMDDFGVGRRDDDSLKHPEARIPVNLVEGPAYEEVQHGIIGAEPSRH